MKYRPAPILPGERRSCLDKRAYSTRKLAQAARRRSERRLPGSPKLFVYRCHYGEHWHLTKLSREDYLARQV